MMLPSRLDCQLSLNTPNMENPGSNGGLKTGPSDGDVLCTLPESPCVPSGRGRPTTASGPIAPWATGPRAGSSLDYRPAFHARRSDLAGGTTIGVGQ